MMPVEMLPLTLGALWLAPGHIWVSNWEDGHNRTLYPLDTDPYERPANVEFSGTGSAYMNGHGTMTLTGNAPRYRVLENFKNVNITLYAKRVDEKKQLDYAGFVIAAHSRHYTDATCGANTYYGQITYNDGSATFEKELFHGRGVDAFYPDVTDTSKDVVAFPGGVPANKWIGIRFIVQDVENDTAVRLQLFLDKEDNGDWVKVLEYTDRGDWPVDSDHVKCDGYYPDDKILTEPGFVFLRNDGLGRADYRDFSIEELP